MSTFTLFERFTDDKFFNADPYSSVRLHPDHTLIKGKFKEHDLVVIAYQGRQTLGILKFETGLSDFNRNSIYLTRDQRRDLALTGREEYQLPLEIKKGKFLHAVIYFFERLAH